MEWFFKYPGGLYSENYAPVGYFGYSSGYWVPLSKWFDDIIYFPPLLISKEHIPQLLMFDGY